MIRLRDLVMALEGMAVEALWVAGACLFGLAVAAAALALT